MLFFSGKEITEELLIKKKDHEKGLDNTWNMPVYYLYLGEVYIKRAENCQCNSPERTRLLDSALEYLNKGSVIKIVGTHSIYQDTYTLDQFLTGL